MFKVLIIDDEEIIREGLIKTINWDEISCSVIGEAEDGDDGIKLVNTLKPDIVITDIRMPGTDGLEMISKIRAEKNDCKIIIITGFRQFEYAQEAVRLGAFRFILKPTKTDELTQAISDAVKEIKKKRTSEEEYKNMQKRVKEYYGLKDTTTDAEKSPDDGNTCSSTYIVNKALTYMRENYANELDLKTLADNLYISTWHLSKMLKRETGSTFVDILNEIRVESAKKLLCDPKYKIYEVAQNVGFTDIPYFTKLFKKHTGITPMEFKNKHG